MMHFQSNAMSKTLSLILVIIGIIGLLNLHTTLQNSRKMLDIQNEIGKQPVMILSNLSSLNESKIDEPKINVSKSSTNDRKPSEQFWKLLQNRVELSKSRVPGRKYVLKSITKSKEYYNLFGALTPEVVCLAKVRIGIFGDGGKWVCNPMKIPDNCVVFSLGLNNQIDFEQGLQGMINNRCIIHGYDTGEQLESTKEMYEKMRGTVHMATIGDDVSIESLAKKESITSLELLKIDIEGSEHKHLIPFLQKMSVCQIFIEIHGGAEQHAALLQKIAQLNYRLFSYEVNGHNINAVEYSFIHENCIDKYGGYRLANYLDFYS